MLYLYGPSVLSKTKAYGTSIVHLKTLSYTDVGHGQDARASTRPSSSAHSPTDGRASTRWWIASRRNGTRLLNWIRCEHAVDGAIDDFE